MTKTPTKAVVNTDVEIEVKLSKRVEVLKALVDDGLEPSPDNLLEASRADGHPLHDALWQKGSDVKFALIGRLEFCRRFIHATKIEWTHGGKTIETRYVEFVRPNGVGKYATVHQIVEDKSLLNAYMTEIRLLNEQAAEKMARLQALMSGDD